MCGCFWCMPVMPALFVGVPACCSEWPLAFLCPCTPFPWVMHTWSPVFADVLEPDLEACGGLSPLTGAELRFEQPPACQCKEPRLQCLAGGSCFAHLGSSPGSR